MFARLKGPISIAALSALVVGLIGLIAVWANIPLLLASFGPTVAIQTTSPRRQIARAWNVSVGHLIALIIGVAAIYATGAVHKPPFLDTQALSLARVAAAAFAVGIGLVIEFLLEASHPPSVATSLLVTLGIVEMNWHNIGAILGGIALVTAFGEAARALRANGP